MPSLLTKTRETLQRYMREPMSAITHIIAAVLALVGLIILIIESLGVPDKMATVIIFGVAMILTFSCSVALHWAIASDKTIAWLARFDHAAIYLLIAGSYTPICYNLLDGFWQWGMLTIVWTIAGVGVILKLSIFDGGQSNWISTGSYLVLGWLAVLAFPHIWQTLPWQATLLIILGGVMYSAGIPFFAFGQLLERRQVPRPFFGPHEFWHLFVMGGAFLHFIAIWRFVAAA